MSGIWEDGGDGRGWVGARFVCRWAHAACLGALTDSACTPHPHLLPHHSLIRPFFSPPAGDEFREILSRYMTIPQENVDAVERQKAREPGLIAAFERVEL